MCFTMVLLVKVQSMDVRSFHNLYFEAVSCTVVVLE